MGSSQNIKRWVLSDEDVREIENLYSNQGWRISRIARKLNIGFRSVYYWVKKLNLERKVGIISSTVKNSRGNIRPGLASSNNKNYKSYLETSHEKAKETCIHAFWIKKCSCCGKVLESDSSCLEKERGLIPKPIPFEGEEI